MGIKRFFATAAAISLALLFQLGCEKQAQKGDKPKMEPVKTAAAAKIDNAKPAAQDIVEQSKAQINFEKVIHDFGEISPNSENICEFSFKNIGKGTLQITEITKTCGCTPFTLEKRTYQPGESGVLKVKYHASKTPGLVTKTLYVKSNDPNNPNVSIALKANIKTKVEYEPKRVELLANVKDGNCPAIRVWSVDGKPFAIKSFIATEDILSAKIDPCEMKTEFVIKPQADLSKMKQDINGNITISLTHPECDSVTIFFSVLPKFKVTPPSLNILEAKAGSAVTREVWIISNYNKDFEIASATSQKGFTKVLKQEKVGNRFKITVEITAPVAPETIRYFSDVLTVKTKDGEEFRVSCRGFYPRSRK